MFRSLFSRLTRRQVVASSDTGLYRLCNAPTCEAHFVELVGAPSVPSPLFPALLSGRYRPLIARLLAEHNYASADALYRRAWHWYPRAEYADLRHHHWEEHRKKVLQELATLLAVFDFAQANDLARRSSLVVTQEEYLREKAIAVRRYFKVRFNEPPNEEQTSALVCPAQHVLVKARAGTGKTRTIVSKCVFR